MTVFSIIISEKGGVERRETFEKAEVTVGRVQGNDLMLPKGNVSKRHCKFEYESGRFVVADQNSTNGTYVNRRRISQATVIREGDRVYVGDFVLRLEAAAGASEVGGSVEPPVPTGPSTEEPFPVPGEQHAAEFAVSRGSMSDALVPELQIRGIATPPHDAGLERLTGAVRFLVERVTAKLEVRVLDRELTDEVQRRVERLLDEVVASLRGEQTTLAVDEPLIREAARAELLELGPLAALLDDPSVSEVTVGTGGLIVVHRGQEISRSGLPFCAARSVDRALVRLCQQEGRPIVEGERAVRRELPSFGFDLDALPALSSPSGALIRLRRRDRVVVSLDDLVQAGTLSRTMSTFFLHCLQARANVLVVGPRGSGAGELVSAFAAATEPDRVLAVGDEEEFASVTGAVTTLNLEGLADPRELLSAIARFPTHRLLVDGFRGERALATLGAICDGADGTIACLRSRGIEKGLAQLVAQIGLAGGGHERPVVDALLACFDIVVEVSRLRDGRSRVLRVAELVLTEPGIVGEDIFDFVVERTANGGFLEGTFRVTGRTPHIASELKAKGSRIDLGMFTRPG